MVFGRELLMIFEVIYGVWEDGVFFDRDLLMDL